ncbi:hypothetical protein B0H13DRAFT_1907714 [Mycena leptocephala]|nr:hypothetical protein B0H13DRAFT_1907714 [Mycena leptocephala]
MRECVYDGREGGMIKGKLSFCARGAELSSGIDARRQQVHLPRKYGKKVAVVADIDKKKVFLLLWRRHPTQQPWLELALMHRLGQVSALEARGPRIRDRMPDRDSYVVYCSVPLLSSVVMRRLEVGLPGRAMEEERIARLAWSGKKVPFAGPALLAGMRSAVLTAQDIYGTAGVRLHQSSILQQHGMLPIITKSVQAASDVCASVVIFAAASVPLAIESHSRSAGLSSTEDGDAGDSPAVACPEERQDRADAGRGEHVGWVDHFTGVWVAMKLRKEQVGACTLGGGVSSACATLRQEPYSTLERRGGISTVYLTVPLLSLVLLVPSIFGQRAGYNGDLQRTAASVLRFNLVDTVPFLVGDEEWQLQREPLALGELWLSSEATSTATAHWQIWRPRIY